MTAGAAPPGWHGKLPSLGDFASRRLDAAFIEAWDGWLAAGLHALREQRPDSWLDDYLGSPSWRFLLMPGVLPGASGAQAWCGVLMPSVDRVGRYFPLTLVLPLGDGPASVPDAAVLWPWLGRLDELARDALHGDWTAERLEDELARMALPARAAPPPRPPNRRPPARWSSCRPTPRATRRPSSAARHREPARNAHRARPGGTRAPTSSRRACWCRAGCPPPRRWVGCSARLRQSEPHAPRTARTGHD